MCVCVCVCVYVCVIEREDSFGIRLKRLVRYIASSECNFVSKRIVKTYANRLKCLLFKIYLYWSNLLIFIFHK